MSLGDSECVTLFIVLKLFTEDVENENRGTEEIR